MLHNLHDINKLSDPLKQYQFTFVISKFRGSDNLSGLATGNTDWNKNWVKHLPEMFELQCTSFVWPGSKVGTSVLNLGDFKRTRPTIQDKSGQWKTTVYETMDGHILEGIRNWLDAIHNPMTGISLPSTLYSSQCEVIFNTPLAKQRLLLRGFYPISLSDIDINPSSSDPVKATVTWNYDWYTESNSKVLQFL